MKKIGLVTYYGENYGGMLQAYALQQYVKEAGYDCKIISNEFIYVPTKQGIKNARINSIKNLVKNPFEYLKRRTATRRSSTENPLKSAKFREFLSKNIDVDYTGYTCYDQYVQSPPEYDVYLCGSDQIWNPNLYNSNGFYFAGFAPNDAVRVSYASSIGVSSVSDEHARFMKPYLDKLDIISTREVDGSKIVEDITGKKVRTVIDPTLLLNGEQWSKVSAERIVDNPYVFCYLFGERDYIAKVKKQVKELTGLEIVCIPFVVREIEGDDTKIFDAGPAEFISLIKNAEFVLTDSFHATAFSINLKTPFLSLCRFAKDDANSMNSRLYTILSLVALENRLIDESDVITKEMLFNIDFKRVHDLLGKKRAEDSQFLLDSIKYERNK